MDIYFKKQYYFYTQAGYIFINKNSRSIFLDLSGTSQLDLIASKEPLLPGLGEYQVCEYLKYAYTHPNKSYKGVIPVKEENPAIAMQFFQYMFDEVCRLYVEDKKALDSEGCARLTPAYMLKNFEALSDQPYATGLIQLCSTHWRIPSFERPRWFKDEKQIIELLPVREFPPTEENLAALSTILQNSSHSSSEYEKVFFNFLKKRKSQLSKSPYDTEAIHYILTNKYFSYTFVMSLTEFFPMLALELAAREGEVFNPTFDNHTVLDIDIQQMKNSFRILRFHQQDYERALNLIIRAICEIYQAKEIGIVGVATEHSRKFLLGHDKPLSASELQEVIFAYFRAMREGEEFNSDLERIKIWTHEKKMQSELNNKNNTEKIRKIKI